MGVSAPSLCASTGVNLRAFELQTPTAVVSGAKEKHLPPPKRYLPPLPSALDFSFILIF